MTSFYDKLQVLENEMTNTLLELFKNNDVLNGLLDQTENCSIKIKKSIFYPDTNAQLQNFLVEVHSTDEEFGGTKELSYIFHNNPAMACEIVDSVLNR